MKKLLVLLITFSMIITSVCGSNVFAAESFDEDCLELYTKNNTKGTVWNEEASPTIYVAVNNPTSAAVSAELSFKVYDEYENEVYSSNKSIAVQAKTTGTEIIDPALPYGIYTAKATISGGFGEITKSIAFSYVKYDGNQNDGLGVSCHILTQLELAEKGAGIVNGGGFGWVRDEILWKYVETTKGKLQVPGDRELYLNMIYESGNKILLILG